MCSYNIAEIKYSIAIHCKDTEGRLDPTVVYVFILYLLAMGWLSPYICNISSYCTYNLLFVSEGRL